MKIFLKSLIFLLFLTPTFSYSYNPFTTHAGLTQEIVDFYNFFYYPQITNEEKELIIQGAIDEDFPKDRSLNHFYDPVRNIGFNGFPTSKQWASGEIIANEFSWQDALGAYARGDEEIAFKTLGHIIHLLEDAGVPDHTRNDPHKGDGLEGAFTNESPYEKWTSQNKTRQTLRGFYLTLASEGIRPKVENSLGNYFDFLANYSNKNFFSKDTIDNRIFNYTEPRQERLAGNYMFGVDKITNKEEKLYIYSEDLKNNLIERVLIKNNDTSVLSSYFERLSRQIIPVGAGVIELFFKEAEVARKKYQEEQEEFKVKEELRQRELLEAEQKLTESGFWDRAKYKIQYVWEYNVKSETFAVAKRLREILTDGPVNLAQQSVYWTSALGFTGQNVGELAATGVVEEVQNRSEQIVEINNFIQEQGNSFNRNDLITGPAFAFSNEGEIDNTEENLEEDSGDNNENTPLVETVFVPTLLNPAQNPIPVGGGAGFGGGAVIVEEPVEEIEVATSTASTTSETVEEVPIIPLPDIIPPDISIVIGECAHSLVIGLCVIATSTVNINWQSTSTDVSHYQLSIDNIDFATTTNTSEERNISEGVHVIKVLAYDGVGNVGTSSEIRIEYVVRPIVISEIAWAGTASSTSNEWMEIYNRSNHTINLSELSLKAIDGTPDINLSGIIAPTSFYLIERSDDNTVPGVVADLVTPFSGTGEGSGGLGNSGEEIHLVQNVGLENIILDTTMPLETMISECGGWCWGGGSGFSTMSRRNLNGLGTVFPTWTRDNTINMQIIESTGMTIRGTPKSDFVVPGGGGPIVPL